MLMQLLLGVIGFLQPFDFHDSALVLLLRCSLLLSLRVLSLCA